LSSFILKLAQGEQVELVNSSNKGTLVTELVATLMLFDKLLFAASSSFPPLIFEIVISIVCNPGVAFHCVGKI